MASIAAIGVVGEQLDELILSEARDDLVGQARALERAAARLDRQFVEAVRLLLACEGRVIVSGMGKSGIVARKIAATLTCTGTPAQFLHPAEAVHGDLGFVTHRDVVVVVTRSGETAEVARLLPHFESIGVAMIAITGVAASTVGRAASIVLDASVEQESCPHGLVPTTSALVAQAMGDALALATVRERALTAADLVRLHPNLDDAAPELRGAPPAFSSEVLRRASRRPPRR